MSVLKPRSAPHSASVYTQDLSEQKSKWLADVSFGEALKQSITLLQMEFRWLVLVFFIGGTLLALILIPVNTTLEVINELAIQELLAFPPNFTLLLDLMRLNTILSFVQTFITFFAVFILNVVTIHQVFQKEPQLKGIAKVYSAPHFPTTSIVATGLVTATLLAIADLLVVATPFVLLFFFFVPANLIIAGKSVRSAISQSLEMRRQHWQRIFGAILLGAIFMVFAHTLGVHVYLTLEYIFQALGISLELVGPVLLIVLTQIPVAMVAPLIPLLSVAFYSGARGVMVEHQQRQFMRALERQRARTQQVIPLERDISVCQKCGTPLRPDSAFCTNCGSAAISSLSVQPSIKSKNNATEN
ncbi:MAG: zinc ribbon domain-containing protein [Candidatus Hodarchaeota archaeon]